MKRSLPPQLGLDIGSLSKLFHNTTTSYKYLFFIGLLNCLVKRLESQNQSRIFDLREIIQELLAFGWYPHKFFRLSYGHADQVGRMLDDLHFDLSERAITNPSNVIALRKAIQNQFDEIGAGQLKRFVPFRLLSPFYQSELKGVPDHRKDRYILALANAQFGMGDPPIYQFIGQTESIELHEAWADYFEKNLTIVRGWALNEWAFYLQKRNPNTPAIIKKIQPPLTKSTLSTQRDIWKLILEEQEFICIYSDEPIEPGHFQLDHFIPWSFICHDQLWNLIPAMPRENTSKGRVLPSARQVEKFIAAQQRTIAASHKTMKTEKWHSIAEDYSAGLNLRYDELLDPNALRKAYEQTLYPLISLAHQLGY